MSILCQGGLAGGQGGQPGAQGGRPGGQPGDWLGGHIPIYMYISFTASVFTVNFAIHIIRENICIY